MSFIKTTLGPLLRAVPVYIRQNVQIEVGYEPMKFTPDSFAQAAMFISHFPMVYFHSFHPYVARQWRRCRSATLDSRTQFWLGCCRWCSMDGDASIYHLKSVCCAALTPSKRPADLCFTIYYLTLVLRKRLNTAIEPNNFQGCRYWLQFWS